MAWSDTKGNWSQRNQRRGQMFTDQHGRKYYGSIELKSGATCGVIEAQYTTVLPVPAMYLERSRNPERPYDLFVNYERWQTDAQREQTEWDLRARSLARRRNADWNSNDAIPRDVLEMMGDRPQPVEPIIAARQGNGWILGFRTTVDERLRQFFRPEQLDPDYNRFNEPNFRDEEYVPERGEFSDDASVENDREGIYSPVPFADDPLDDELDGVLSLEEQIDPKAMGGKATKVRSPDAERKAKWRADRKAQQAAAMSSESE